MKIHLFRILAASLTLTLFHPAASAADTEAPALNEILQRHLEAMGGLNNWSRVESIQFNGTIERGDQTVDIVIVKKRPNRIRATVTVPIPGKEDAYFQVIRAHDGTTAWTATRLAGAPKMKKEELPAEAAQELLADAGVLPPLIKLWRGGADLALLGSETLDGQTTYAIEATSEDLPGAYTFHLCAESYLVTHYESRHPEHGTTRTTLGDYRSEHNVLIPTRSTIQDDQTGESIMSTTSVKVGVGIYEEYFGMSESFRTAEL